MAAFAWDDLRFVLAVAEARSLAGAARRLGVNHTTVLRRIAALEERLGVRLFERLPAGHALTPAGEQVVDAARETDDRMTALERRLLGQDLRPSGIVRVTTTDTLMASILPALLAEFRAIHPRIVLEVTQSNRLVDLNRRDADVAIRPADDPPQTMIGRRIADVAFAIHGAPVHRPRSPVLDLSTRPWIGLDETLAHTTVARWMRSNVPDEAVVLRVDSLLAMQLAARAGLGLAALPCYLGATAPELVRIQGPIAEMRSALWILSHPDLRYAARVRAFAAFAVAALSRHRSLFEGRRSGATRQHRRAAPAAPDHPPATPRTSR
jgi:DNA-binding transcriptional LysR family regulator